MHKLWNQSSRKNKSHHERLTLFCEAFINSSGSIFHVARLPMMETAHRACTWLVMILAHTRWQPDQRVRGGVGDQLLLASCHRMMNTITLHQFLSLVICLYSCRSGWKFCNYFWNSWTDEHKAVNLKPVCKWKCFERIKIYLLYKFRKVFVFGIFYYFFNVAINSKSS